MEKTNLQEFKHELLDAIKATKQETMEALNTSNQELLETINTFATHVDASFVELRAELRSEVSGLKHEISGLKSDIGGIKSSMVTKSYLDEKIASLRGDTVAMVRKEDIKVDGLTGILAKKKVLTKIEEKEVVHMGPFPKA